MPYIGNTSPSRFVSNRAASVYSGDGSTVAFTLEQAVVQDEDILVSVDGVVQEPSVAYAVSNGTTLTFTGAPSSNAGNNIFVYYLASQVGTVGHPSNQALSATNGTFSGNTTVAGTSTFTGDVTIGDASAADKKILFDGNAQDYHIGLDDSADSLIIGKGSALGTTTSMAFNADGIITKPLQPAFLALPSSTIVNLSTGANANLAFATERFDQNSDYNNSNYTFTAPVTGKYQANIVMYINQLDSAVAYYEFSIVSSNKTYYTIFDPDFSQDNAYFTLTFAALIDMDAADTATIGLHQQGGSSQTDVSAQSNWSMYLVC
jgi:hypothetical protein